MFIRLRIYLHIILSLVVGRHALENLALNKAAEMSTQRTTDSGADGAVDGNTAQTIDSASCALTALDKAPEAWWRVDLNGTFAISEIKIYLLDSEIYRFRHYSVHFTDDITGWRSSQYCTEDHLAANGPSSSVVRLNCDGKGRYLTIWLNRAIDCTPADNINQCDILQLCEVQVLGCYPGDYSQNCNKKCPVNCRDGICSIDDGKCFECKDGYLGNTCDAECDSGKFGWKCSQVCNGRCRDGDTCSHINGYCPTGCIDGYTGAYCHKTCSHGLFGFNCTQECGNCLNNKTCLYTNGICDNGCGSGWNGSYCNTSCDSGHYGVSCRNTCSVNCQNSSNCDVFTGTCTGGCKGGWTGQLCDKKCRHGTYGSNCTDICGNCYLNKTCDNVNGICKYGCDKGWEGTHCKTECDAYKYGYNCSGDCSGNCRDNVTCNRYNGTCDAGCNKGWTGVYCNQTCTYGTYGYDCAVKCSGNCKNNTTCDTIDGSCSDGCKEGWKGIYCNKSCEDGKYGENCAGKCGSCSNSTCLRTNGTCLNGCGAGFKGSLCKTNCSSGEFGENCRYNCSRHCSQNDVCDKKTGYCPKGCDRGWTGDHCNTTCTAGTFGYGCNETCGHCLGNDNCTNYNGTCTRGCQTGRTGDTCKEWCPDGTYGFKCEANCSSNCNTTCNKTTGECDTGCIGGWEGLYCNKPCDKGTYGPGCMYNCSGNCKGNESCSIVNGKCPNGCDEGWRADTCHKSCIAGTFGENCQYQCGGCHNQTVCDIKTDKTSEDHIIMHPEELPVVPIVSGVTIATSLIVIVLVVLIILRKRRIQETKTDQQTPQPLQPMKSVYENVSIRATNRTKKQSYANVNVQFEVDTEDEGVRVQEEIRSINVYYNTTNTNFVDAIPVSDIKEVIERKSLDENNIFFQEFDALPKGFIEKCDVAKQPQNIPKNRYKSTFAYDHSRVILKGNGEKDYINANYVDGTLSRKIYIASQGPKESTFRDHWCMIWQEQVEKIVMLTNLVENRKIKCDQYWPNENSSTLHAGEFNISIVTEKVRACYTIRNLTVTNEDLNETRNVTHYHFTTWPDHGVPDPLDIVLFHIRVNTTETYGPLLVHCSAGIGRTGTYIALDALMDSCRESGTLNVFEYVRLMRNDRVGMIQTLNQYIAVHSAVMEHLRTVHHNIPKSTFADDVTIKLNSENRDEFEEEFKMIESMKPNYNNEDFKTGLLEENSLKNFSKDILPMEIYAAFLPSNVKGQVEYINAVYVPSYTDHHGFIVTQIPTLETDSEFLSLLFDHYVTTVVVLLSNDENMTKCSWLACTKIQTHRGVVKLHSSDITSQDNDIEERVVTLKRKTREVSVHVLSVSCLKKEEIDSTKLHTLVRLASLLKTRNDSHGQRAVLMSQDGVMGCGVLLTLYNAIQQLQLDDEVDIPTIVRRMKVRRPQLCSNSSEYMLCYQIVAEYLIETHVYANT